VIALAMLSGAAAAFAAGYIARRWRFVPVLAVLGLAIITIDVTTRDLTSGGHDDRRLVALTELMVLVGALVLLAVGVALRRWRDRHRSSPRRPATQPPA
jgi:uncharacterized membrane protein YhaH (DUF805 family)